MMPENERLIVIGGGPAGMSAASAARRRQPEREIVVFERGEFVSSILCILPFFISNLVPSVSSLVVYTPEYFQRERRIQVLTGHEVLRIDPLRRTVNVLDRRTGQRSDWSYSTLILATGATANRPTVPSSHLTGVFSLHSIEDAVAIKAHLEHEHPRRAIVIGAGYLGLEMAEAFRSLGLQVVLCEVEKSILPGWESHISSAVEEELERNGVEVRKGERLLDIGGDSKGRARRVLTTAGEYEAEVVLLAAGVTPASELLAEAGGALGVRGAVHVNDEMLTSLPGVLAAGDVAEAWHRVARAPAYVPLGTTANRQGRIAGGNAAGAGERFAGVLGTSAVKVFGLEVARTGLGSREATEAGYWALSDLQPASTTLSHPSRTGIYPGSTPITVVLIAEAQSRRLLGAQMVGREAVAKRLDTVATALYAGLTLDDLAQLDLTYVPPLAPSVEAVAMAAQRLLREL